MPSSLSSILVLGAILFRRSLKIEISQNEKLKLTGYALELGDLVGPLDFKISQIFTLQILLARFQFLQNCWFQFSPSFWFKEKLGFYFPEIQQPKKFDPWLNRCALERYKFLYNNIFRIPTFEETLISFGGIGERVSPCEICSIQASSDTMLIFHMLSQISLVFKSISQQQHMQDH